MVDDGNSPIFREQPNKFKINFKFESAKKVINIFQFLGKRRLAERNDLFKGTPTLRQIRSIFPLPECHVGGSKNAYIPLIELYSVYIVILNFVYLPILEFRKFLSLILVI